MFKKPLILFTTLFIIAGLLSSCEKDNRPTRAYYHYLETPTTEYLYEELVESFEDRTTPAPELDGQRVSSLGQIAKFVLMQGNNRFVNGNTLQNQWNQENPYPSSTGKPNPIAVIFSIDNLEASAHNIFDQKQGSFVMVQAFNNIENTLKNTDAPLLLVMGSTENSRNLEQVKTELQKNITLLTENLFVQSLLENEKLEIVGTLYDLSTKKVDFLKE
jgi:hypothetical protein